jgi:hypothetical protein
MSASFLAAMETRAEDQMAFEKARKYEEEYGEPWPDEETWPEDRDGALRVECDECGAYRNTDLDDFAGYCVFRSKVCAWYCYDCWQDHADTCRNPECPFAQCGHCQVCGEDREELSEKWEAIRCACDAERRTMNLTLLKEFPMCCECKKRICKDCRVENEFIEDEIVSCEHQVNNQRQAR